MSGKKGSNRIKGNLKPSSSSQAALLLSNQPQGFIGFGAQCSPSFVPLSQMLDDVDSTLDADIRLILRKLSKRDTTTKLKALQELSDICEQKDVVILKSMLPFWPRLYNRLSMDFDHKVREAVHETFLVVSKRVGKEIAPYLKSVIGSWTLSQCDTYPTVASSAVKVFQCTFPAGKQNEAFTVYRKDILDFLVDNLVNQTAQSLSDPKTTSAEDMESKHTRTVTSSLIACRKLIEALTPEKLPTLDTTIRTLFDIGKFWKYGKSSAPGIKAGFYSFISSICQYFPDLANTYVDKITGPVLHNLDVSSPIIVGPMWEAVLSVVNHVSDCWKHVSWQKAFWSKLRKALENGCYGNASVIGPNIMPLLSKIPESMFGNEETFFIEFLTSFMSCFKVEGLLNSQIERSALVKSFVECCHFIVVQLTFSDSKDNKLAERIVKEYLIELVQMSFSDKHLASSSLYCSAGSLMHVLEKSPRSIQLANIFWTNLKDFLTIQINSCDEDMVKRTLILVKGFLSQKSVAKKSAGVKFSFSKSLMKQSEDISELSSSQCFVDFYTDIIIGIYLKMQNQQQHVTFFPAFAELFMTFINTSVLATILQKNDQKNDTMLYKAFFDEVLVPLFKTHSNSLIHTKNLISMSFKCLLSCDPTECEQGLLQLKSLCQDMIQCSLFLEHILEMEPSLLTKLSAHLEKNVIAATSVKLVIQTSELSSKPSSENDKAIEHGWCIITKILAACGKNDSLFDSQCLEAILIAIGQEIKSLKPLCKNKDSSTAHAIYFVTTAVCSFFDHLTDISCNTATEELMTTLFTLSFDSNLCLNDSVLKNCELAWTKGLRLLLESQNIDVSNGMFISMASEVIKGTVSDRDCSVDKLEKAINVVKSMVDIIVEIYMLDVDKCAENTFQTLFKNVYVDFSSIMNQSSLTDLVYISDNELTITEYCNVSSSITTKSTLSPLVVINQAKYNINLLNTSLIVERNFDDVCIKPWDIDNLLSVVKAFVVANVIVDSEGVNSQKLMSRHLNSLKREIGSHLNSLQESDIKKVLQKAIDKSENNGEVDSIVLKILGKIMVPKLCLFNETQMVERWSEIFKGSFHTIQAVLPFFTSESIQSLAEARVSVFVTSLSTTNEWLSSQSLSIFTSCLSELSKRGENSKLEPIVSDVLDHILLWREQNDKLFLSSNKDFKDTLIVANNIEIIRMLSLTIRLYPEKLKDKDWDMVLCCLVDWIQKLCSYESYDLPNVPFVLFAESICGLIMTVSDCMHTKVKHSDSSVYPENLWTEWCEFFSDGVFGDMLPLYVSLVGKHAKNVFQLRILIAVGKAVTYSSLEQLLKHKLGNYLLPDDDENIPQTVQTLLNHVCPLILNKQLSVQTTSFNLLEKLMTIESFRPTKQESDNITSEEPCVKALPKSIVNIIQKCGDAMELVMGNITIGDSFTIETGTEEYQYAYGYLLSWKLILVLFKTADPQFRAMYASYLRDTNLFSRFLRHLFLLLPIEKAQTCNNLQIDNSLTVQSSAHTEYTDIQQLAFNIYYLCLQTTPALIRQWWTNLDRKTSLSVEKFTSKYVSHILCTEEISSVLPSSSDLDGITIKPRPTTKEVVATYIMAEVKIVVTITLPDNFPLGVIAVSSDKRVGATQAQWDRWLLQLNIFLQYQNGTVIEGLKLWKKNIDKRFEGVEDCMICFSVLHGTTFQLPKLQCRTCKKKYHSACLYKWFSTSMNSTCPLCRNLF